MKMLFFSTDSSEVQLVSSEFVHAGIPCEVREGPPQKNGSPQPPHTEVWIRNDRDCHKALLLCAQLGIGFCRRPARPHEQDDQDWESAWD